MLIDGHVEPSGIVSEDRLVSSVHGQPVRLSGGAGRSDSDGADMGQGVTDEDECRRFEIGFKCEGNTQRQHTEEVRAGKSTHTTLQTNSASKIRPTYFFRVNRS